MNGGASPSNLGFSVNAPSGYVGGNLVFDFFFDFFEASRRFLLSMGQNVFSITT